MITPRDCICWENFNLWDPSRIEESAQGQYMKLWDYIEPAQLLASHGGWGMGVVDGEGESDLQN